MKYLFYWLAILLLLGCSKNDGTTNDNGLPHFNETFQVRFTMDGKNYSKVFDKDSTNPGYSYSTETSPGYFYFSKGCHINLSASSFFRIILGSAQGSFDNNWQSAYESFKSLVNKGTKTYDSIQFCTQLQTNKVEIMFVDENRDVWSSTKWTFINNQVIKSLDQPGSNFEITSYKEVSTGRDRPNNAAIIKGTFNCALYKADTHEKRLLTNGTFTILVGM